MTTSDFDPCLAIILKEEGGNDDDPHDPGGRTSRGITEKEWNVYIKTHSGLPDDVWKAPDSDVAAIYHDGYWLPYCDDLPAGVDLVVFNTSVNSGRTQAIKELQRSLGVGVDGMFGIITKNAVQSCADIPGLIRKMCDYRRDFYRALKTFKYYGKGWLARTDRIQNSALAMAAQVAATSIVRDHPQVDTLPSQPDVTVSAKAEVDDVSKPKISPETGMAATTASAAGGGILDQIQNTISTLQPFSDTINIAKYALIGLSLVALGITVYGIWHRSQTAEAIG